MKGPVNDIVIYYRHLPWLWRARFFIQLTKTNHIFFFGCRSVTAHFASEWCYMVRAAVWFGVVNSTTYFMIFTIEFLVEENVDNGNTNDIWTTNCERIACTQWKYGTMRTQISTARVLYLDFIDLTHYRTGVLDTPKCVCNVTNSKWLTRTILLGCLYGMHALKFDPLFHYSDWWLRFHSSNGFCALFMEIQFHFVYWADPELIK